MAQSSTDYLKGVIFCLIAAVAWGGMFPVMTHALVHVDPFNFTAARYTLVALAFSLLLARREGIVSFDLRRETKGTLFLAWVFGTVGFAGFNLLVFWGQQLSGPEGALSASIMMATMPMMGLLVGWVLKGIRPPLYSFIFIVMSFVGVALVVSKGDFSAMIERPQHHLANAAFIGGALSWVVYTFGATYFPKWSPYRFTTLTNIFGMVSVYGIIGVLELTGAVPLPSMTAFGAVIPHMFYGALIAGFAGVLTWNLGTRAIGPNNSVLFINGVPLTAFVISALTGVIPNNAQIVGALCTAAALILNNLFQRRAAAVAAAPAQAPAQAPAREPAREPAAAVAAGSCGTP